MFVADPSSLIAVCRRMNCVLPGNPSNLGAHTKSLMRADDVPPVASEGEMPVGRKRLAEEARSRLTPSAEPDPVPVPLAPGIVAFLAAFPLAFLVANITGLVSGRPERGVMLVGLCFAVMLPVPPIVYWIARGRAVAPERLATVMLLSLVVLLTGIDLFWLGAHVVFPADILIWSESDFVNDILKLRVGYPLYTAQVNNESFIYTPGSQLLTWLLAMATGKGGSLVAYRAIQVGYTAVAALVAMLCCRRLIELAAPGRLRSGDRLWSAIWLPALFLMASNAITNPFVQNLHNDALTQLLAVTAFWVLLEYMTTHDRRWLAWMAVIPAMGFLVKQSLAVWAGLYCLELLFFDRPRSLRRVAAFAAVSFGAVAICAVGCYLIWGEPFTYWTITVLKAHPFSFLRSVQHVLEAWVYFVVGIAGGLVLIRGERRRTLASLWLVWFAFILFEAYTSGVAWMLNHLGPGSLIAGIWFLAGARLAWPDLAGSEESLTQRSTREDRGETELWLGGRWLRPAGVAAIGALLLGGLGTVRIPAPPFPLDALRYVTQIEQEFRGLPVNRVLLDVGTWVYLKDGVVMKDRAAPFGDRGLGGVGDFTGMIRRLHERRYAKILVRNYHSPDFWYDHYLWAEPSGIRLALASNYHEVGTIPAVSYGDPTTTSTYLFSEISILVPNSIDSPVTSTSRRATSSSQTLR